MASGLGNERVPSALTSVDARVSLRLDDLVVLTIVSACALEASSKLLGVRDPIVQSFLVIGWTAAAARRLVAWRHGQGPLHLDRPSQKLTVVACTAPLFLMQLVNPWSMTGGRLSSPFWLQAIGGLSILVSLLAPFCVRRSRMLVDRTPGSGRPSLSLPEVEFWARAIGFILLTASPAVLAAVCVSGTLRRWTASHGPVGSVSVAPASIDIAPSRNIRRDGSLKLLPA